MTPYQVPGGYGDWEALLALILDSFAYMDGVIDPPSSAHRLTPASMAQKARDEHLYLVGAPPVACAFFRPEPDALYVGKLAVSPAYQRQGLGAALMAEGEALARRLGLPKLRLETRVELTGNHAAFARMGFVKIAEKAHAGFDRATSITMEKTLV
ncbi:GNAT family N-acetyltransferase [Pseudoprimorskyibacter insulae]|uniref:N-acetyltransferase domain-containing protein n=1 Tax=Pseudoprimorskyibacter insulae TaxID=1695997 RepID=A0A2R8AVY6_9RHOB|nr:GNAT family N-acetyltransferase [Pseudoprimorskyibacter insulae]SPF80202.1 hypothetical protein PRI8871_02008 [Pseudoprimorskyibacter insulae]